MKTYLNYSTDLYVEKNIHTNNNIFSLQYK